MTRQIILIASAAALLAAEQMIREEDPELMRAVRMLDADAQIDRVELRAAAMADKPDIPVRVREYRDSAPRSPVKRFKKGSKR